MGGYKPVKQVEAWLLTADRYMAEIAAAERAEALAAAISARARGNAVRRGAQGDGKPCRADQPRLYVVPGAICGQDDQFSRNSA